MVTNDLVVSYNNLTAGIYINFYFKTLFVRARGKPNFLIYLYKRYQLFYFKRNLNLGENKNRLTNLSRRLVV